MKDRTRVGLAGALLSRRWSERQARCVLAALEESRDSLEEFARRYGVKMDRVRVWQKRFDAASSDSTIRASRASEVAPQSVDELFLPVHVLRGGNDDAALGRGDARQPLQDSGLELVLGAERVVRIATGFDAETLARVVGTLEAVPC